MSQLDTNNIYRKIESYNEKGENIDDPSQDKFYTKFYGQGRASSFSIHKNRSLTEQELNPICHSKKYYVIFDNGKALKTECFVRGDSFYFIQKGLIGKNGDMLRFISKDKTVTILVKENIPKTWIKYKFNW